MGDFGGFVGGLTKKFGGTILCIPRKNYNLNYIEKSAKGYAITRNLIESVYMSTNLEMALVKVSTNILFGFCLGAKKAICRHL